MCLSGPWTYFQAQNRLVDTGIGLRPHNDQEFRAYAGASWGYGISTASKHKEAAWEFVKFMTMAQEGPVGSPCNRPGRRRSWSLTGIRNTST